MKQKIRQARPIFVTSIFCAALLAAGTVHAQSADLPQLVAEALTHHPNIAVSRAEEEVAKSQLQEVKAGYLPQIDVQYQIGRENTDSPAINDQKLTTSQGRLTLSQLLFDGFATWHQIQAQEAQVTAAAGRVYETAEDTALSVAEAYTNLRREYKRRAILEQNLQAHRDILVKIQAGAKAGVATKGDVAQARVRLDLAQIRLTNVQEQIDQAIAALARELGRAESDIAPMQADLFVDFGLEMQSILAMAELQNPTLTVLEAEIIAADKTYQAQKGRFSPQVNLELSGSQGKDTGGLTGDDTRSSAMAVARWNLFRGGADQARVKTAQERKKAAQNRLLDTKRQIKQQVETNWAELASAKERYRFYQSQEMANKQVLDVYMTQYELGQRSLLDVLDGQRELSGAQENQIIEDFNIKLRIFRLLALQGRLISAITGHDNL